LAGVVEPAEIRDPSGKVLGRFTPMFEDENDKHGRAAEYFDLAESERALTQKGQGSTVSEVWERNRTIEPY
jgi:hypothetical protein